MKIKLLLLFTLIFAFSTISFAQSVVITSKKTTYTRRKPISDFKKTFTVNYPKVKAANLLLSKKIETAIGYEQNKVINLKEEMGEYQWLEEADFTVGYNKNGVLSINLFVTGTAAYPTSLNKNIVVDLKTGSQVRPIDVFANINGLVAKLKAIQKQAVKDGIEEIKKDPDFQQDKPEDLFQYTDFKSINLEGFAVDDKGVTFFYEYGFPHVIKALEPNGNYFLTWGEIKPFIKQTGLLGRFIR